MIAGVHRFEAVGSTMDEARALAVAGAAECSWVIARRQTAGRGRRGRSWWSPESHNGALYATVVLRPRLAPRRAGELSMRAALGVHEAAREIVTRAGGDAGALTLKWPNDLLAAGRKVAGVLIEGALREDAFDHVLVGVGLNVALDFASAPAEVQARATSLQALCGSPLDLSRCEDALLGALTRWLTGLAADAPNPVGEYTRCLDGLGAPARLRVGGEDVAGVLRGVRDDGALLLDTATGPRAVSYGEYG